MGAMFGRIRWRLTRWNLLVLGLSLTVLAVAVYVTFSRTLMSQLDGALQGHATEVMNGLREAERAGRVDREGYEGGRFTLVLSKAGAVVANPQGVDVSGFPAGLTSGTLPAFVTMSLGVEPVRLYLSPIPGSVFPGDVLAVGQSLADEDAALQRLLIVILIVGGAVLAVSCVGAWFLATKALDPIEQAFRRQQEFAADASHELRTPLTVIRSASDLLAQHASEPLSANAELLDDIRQEIGRMERLTADLLTLARSDLGQLDLAVGTVDVASLAADAVRRVTPLAKEHGIDLTCSNAAKALTVEGDPDRLSQVLLILLDNALKHTSRGDRITVATRTQGSEVVIEVNDTGEGISAEHLSRIFDRFYRADQSRSRQQGGAGLGLAIAQAIAAAHGGHLTLTSARGHGTSAVLRLRLDPVNGAGTVVRGRAPRASRF